MSFNQHHVSPRLPTALAEQARLDLPGHDVLLLMLQNVHIVSTKIHVPIFEEALSKTLQLYPHVAGQLRYSDDRWFIELTNSGIPIDVDYKVDTTSDALLNGDWVVQDDLSMFINHQFISLGPTDADAPLVRLKLTLFENETAIGITWHHALGDAISMLRFMHTLSQFYQGLPLTYPPPTFEKYHFPPPSPSMTDEFWPSLSHLHYTCPLSEFRQVYGGFLRHFQDLKWRFDNDELARLRSILSLRAHDQSYLSKQDCLSAYVVAVLNRSAGRPVQTVASVSSYRDTSAPFAAANGIGNMIQTVPASVPQDMAGIATALRRALQRCKDPQYIERAMAVSSEKMLDIARAGRGLNWTVCDDALVTVNSNVSIDWCSAHFGCVDGSRFYTTRTLRHWLRCFRSNPMKGDDGVWRTRQSIDISMGVSPELKPRMLEILAHGFEYILDDEDPNV